MAIHFKVMPCTNPAGAEGTDYACDKFSSAGMVQTKQLAERISFATSVNPSDVMGIISAFNQMVKMHVLQGDKITLDDFGIMRPTLESRCFPVSAIAADDFDPATYIEKANTNFRATAELKNYIRAYKTFKRDPSDLMA